MIVPPFKKENSDNTRVADATILSKRECFFAFMKRQQPIRNKVLVHSMQNILIAR